MTLIGPKPDVDMPTLPTPWESADRRVVDANGREVLAVAEWLTDEQQDRLTAYIADTINRAYGQQGAEH